MDKIKQYIRDFFDEFFTNLQKYWYLGIVIALLIAFDLITKSIFTHKNFEIIENLLYITYAENTGASFGMLKGHQTLFLITTPFVLLLFMGIMFGVKTKRSYFRFALAFMIAGALGNYIDRVALGYVRDFVHIVYLGYDLPFFGKEFAIFNMADNFLTFGSIAFCVFMVFHYEDGAKKSEGDSGFNEDKEEVSGLNEDKEEEGERVSGDKLEVAGGEGLKG